MYEIILELNHYDGPLEGICQQGNEFYYYCLQEHPAYWVINSNGEILSDSPRTYYLYHLHRRGGPLTRNIITESELKK